MDHRPSNRFILLNDGRLTMCETLTQLQCSYCNLRITSGTFIEDQKSNEIFCSDTCYINHQADLNKIIIHEENYLIKSIDN